MCRGATPSVTPMTPRRPPTPFPQAWVEARKASDFAKFAPFLQTWVDLSREKAKYIDPKLPAYE